MQILLVLSLLLSLFSASAWANDVPPSPVYRTLGQVASPGLLSKPHKDLESIDRCGKCHELNISIPNDNCLECHKMILKMARQQRGLHGKTKELCIKCHLEHKGLEFDISGLKEDDFDHKGKTGFALEGKHHDLKCEKCHNPEYMKEPLLREDGKKKDKTWLGLKTGCLDCHKDIHDGKLDENCLKCHTMAGWRPKEGQQSSELLKFDHNRDSKFELEGAHKELKCDKCHKPDQARKELRIFKPLKHERCLDCHRDEHREQLGTDCLKCHTTSAWTETKGGLKFKHNKDSKYELKGAHQEVKCDKCHKSNTGKTYNRKFKPIKHAECLDCHKEEHDNKFGRDCLRCHLMTTWKDYSLVWALKDFDHGKLDYKLEGKHEKIDCRKCHIKDNKPRFKKIAHEACLDCHKDQHRGQFKEKKCTDCHRKIDWKDLAFSHDDARFKLSRDHKEKKCVKCHEDGKYRGLPVKCTECHRESVDYFKGIVAGKVVGRPDAMAGLMECEKCHDQKTEKKREEYVRERCVECHNDHYGDFFDYWETRLDADLDRYKDELNALGPRRDVPKDEVESLLRLRRVVKHERFHNIDLTRKLMRHMEERLWQYRR
ncbi:MAG: hypothetical protein OEV28_03150 [Nitrospirota bacterium]|nr:hypothetical protein [Nitrospirota bacterium]